MSNENEKTFVTHSFHSIVQRTPFRLHANLAKQFRVLERDCVIDNSGI